MTEEQRRALALARARIKAQTAKTEAPEEKRTFLQDIGRQLGLTARYGIEGALGLADTVAAPIRMLQNSILPEDMRAGPAAPHIADKLGLPQPETGAERIVGGVSRALAGAGGAAGGAQALSNVTVQGAKPILKWLGGNTGLQAKAAIGSGLGGSLAQEAGAGPYGQLAASLAGGLAAPAAAIPARALIEPVKDIAATVGAATYGSKAGVRSLVTDSVERLVGDQKQKLIAAMGNARELVPGVKPTVGEAIAGSQMGQPERFGGGIVRLQKDLTGAAGVEDALPSAYAHQKSALEKASETINARTGPMRDAALQAANQGGVRSENVIGRINEILATPGRRASSVVSKSLNAIKKRIERFSPGGIIDSNDLYTIRKDIGSIIGKYSKETQTWDKRTTAALQKDVQLAIDDAIEKAGGTGWKDYLKNYSLERRGMEAHEARAQEMKQIANQVKTKVGANIAPGEIPQPPTLLSRPMMLLNYGLRFLSKDANDPVVKELTRLLQNPKEFAEVLYRRPVNDPLRQRVVEIMARAASAQATNGEQ